MVEDLIVENNKVKDIKEKAPVEYSNYLGCGTFYFDNGELLLKYINSYEN